MLTKEERRQEFRKHCVEKYPHYAKARAVLDRAEAKQKEVSDAFQTLKQTLEHSFLKVKKDAKLLPIPDAKADIESISRKIKSLEEAHRKTVSDLEEKIKPADWHLKNESIWLQTDENGLIYKGDLSSNESERIQDTVGEVEEDFKKLFASIVTTQTSIIGSTSHLSLEINQLIEKYLKPFETLIQQRIINAVKPFQTELNACYATIAELKKELAHLKKDDKPFDAPAVTAFPHSPVITSLHPVTGTSSSMFSVTVSTGSTNSAPSSATNALRDDFPSSDESSMSTPASPVMRPGTPNLQ